MQRRKRDFVVDAGQNMTMLHVMFLTFFLNASNLFLCKKNNDVLLGSSIDIIKVRGLTYFSIVIKQNIGSHLH